MAQATELARFNDEWWKTACRFFGLMLGCVIFVLLIFAPPAPAVGDATHLTAVAAWCWFVSFGTVAALIWHWTYKFALIRYCWWQVLILWVLPWAFSQLCILFFDLALNIYPVPFCSFSVGAPAASVSFGLAYALLPAKAKADKARLHACLHAWAGALWLICCLLLWILYRALFNTLTGVVQALAVMLLPVLRFISLRIMEAISSRAAPDGSLDAAASFSLKHYNSFFAASLYGNASSISSLLIVLQELVGTSAYLLKMNGFMDRVVDVLCRRNRVRPVEPLPSIEESDGSDSEGQTWRERVLYGEKPLLSHRFRRMLRTSGFLAMEDVVEVCVVCVVCCAAIATTCSCARLPSRFCAALPFHRTWLPSNGASCSLSFTTDTSARLCMCCQR
eukprot:PLAT16141.1.p1 GENE.PLAT16141.1~~PLAT16141.1.p1  ORF type:complete len:432 (+),score=81.86 PLAT16141.1:123-1298(+)